MDYDWGMAGEYMACNTYGTHYQHHGRRVYAVIPVEGVTVHVNVIFS